MPDPIAYEFDTDEEGWTTVNNGAPTYYATGGNTGGYFGGADAGGGIWYYRAPASMLGDREGYFGGTLSFDLFQADTTSPIVNDDVILEGGGVVIVATLPSAPGLTWTNYSIDIEVGAFRIGSDSGRIATETEIRTVLANLERLDIRGEYRNGADSSGLDNVVLAEGAVDSPAITQTAITSTFDTSIQGWAFREDVAEFRHVGTGGNPDGYLEVVDAVSGLVWFYVAPDAYLDDKSPFYGGLISFDLKQSSTSSQFDADDVILRSGSTVLAFDTAANPGTDWTHYDIQLDTSAAWHVGDRTGPLATEQEIRDVLANLTSFEIRGEYRSGSDTGGLDSVVMQTPSGVIAGTSGNDGLVGTNAFEQLYGLAGNDMLDGGSGPDAMIGGTGDDLYYVDDAGDTVTELSGEGTDEVSTTLATYFLGANVENLTGTLGTKQTLVGNVLGNTIQGGAGNDVINGLAGNDVMKGGAGNDAYYVYDAGDVVTELYDEGTDIVYAYASHTLGANVENLTLLAAGLTGTGNAAGNLIYGSSGADTIHGMGSGDRIDGGGGNDTLYGDDGADAIWGGAGNDVIYGGAGIDYMVGGSGDDTYYVTDAGDTAIEQAGEGTDTVYASTATHQLRPNIEVLIGTLSTGQTLLGNYGADTIQGGAGNDVINGLAGNDTMKGGAGNDAYYVYDAGDTIVENPGEGTDTVYTYVSHTLAANVENLTLLNAGNTGTGNDLANTIYGSSGIDTIFGMGGADQIASGGGADTIDAGAGDDLVWGGAGNDVIRGGLGFDRLRGEAGADRFVFGEGEASASRASADRLLDFSQAEGDRIDLSLIDANSTGGAPGDQAFAFIGSAAFSNVAGELRYEQSGGFTWVEGDTNGDGIADFSIQLGSILTPVAADFVL